MPLFTLAVMNFHLSAQDFQGISGSKPLLYDTSVAAIQGIQFNSPGSFLRDSLELQLLETEIAKAEELTSSTTLWHRLIPQVSISWSLSIRDFAFLDPSSMTPYIIPRDAARLTVSLSLAELMNSTKHTLAELELIRLRTQPAQTIVAQKASHHAWKLQQSRLEEELALVREEMALTDKLLQYHELLFEQGTIDFVSLTRTRLQLINTRKEFLRLSNELQDTNN